MIQPGPHRRVMLERLNLGYLVEVATYLGESWQAA